jgi:hypothetical protein
MDPVSTYEPYPMQFSTRQYNLLERAIDQRLRISIVRRGSEYIVLPERLVVRVGRETIETVQPSTGDRMTICLDDIEAFEIVGG